MASHPVAGVYDPIASARGRPWMRRLNILQDALLLAISSFFFYVQLRAIVDGNYFNIPFAIEQGILVAMFLFRRRSRATTARPLEWLVAGGAWLPLLFRPTGGDGSLVIAGALLQLGGLLLVCAGMIALGRSFGVVAANRGLKVSGPYQFVRHPIYLAYIVSSGGFLMTNFSMWNLAICVITISCHLLRIRAEERVLTATGDYANYASRVRARLIPGVY